MYHAQCTIFTNGEEIVKAFKSVKPGEYHAILMDHPDAKIKRSGCNQSNQKRKQSKCCLFPLIIHIIWDYCGTGSTFYISGYITYCFRKQYQQDQFIIS